MYNRPSYKRNPQRDKSGVSLKATSSLSVGRKIVKPEVDFTNHPLNNNSYSNSTKEVKTIAIAIDDRKIDYLLDEYRELYPDNYRKWHAKFIKTHGDDTWVRCAKTAQQEGNSPQRYFVWLLNRQGS